VSKKNLGSSIDDFLKKENIFEEAQAQAIKEVVAWQLAKAMKRKKISKARMAVLLKTSRSQARSHSRSETRYYVGEFAAGSGAGGATGGGGVGLG
jgi:hypothetical protein